MDLWLFRNASAISETIWQRKIIQAKESKAIANNTAMGFLNLFFLPFLPYILVWVNLLFR